MKDLKDFQQSISGVSIDEEMAEMIKFQHGYNATARFITEADKMLDTIINRMGV
jgi:flagellar hook-associated protein 1 FlgK